jgi:uncharacterized protein YdeI (YjbR/CyaY-like superfamily)
MLKAAGVDVGDVANVEVEFDAKPREVLMPQQFAEALENNHVAMAAYQRLKPSRRKEILRYLGFLKRPNRWNATSQK